MKVSILPKSLLGWLSVGSVVALFVVAFACEDIISPEGIGKYSTGLRASIDYLLIGIAGAAVITGIISIIRRKQGAILVFLSTAFCLFILIEMLLGYF